MVMMIFRLLFFVVLIDFMEKGFSISGHLGIVWWFGG